MRLRFEMSIVGASADDALSAEVNSGELPDGERAALQETLEALRSGDDAGLASPAAAEGTIYRLQVSGDGRHDTIAIVYDEATLPVDLRPLIELLRDLAIEARIASSRVDDDRRCDQPPGDQRSRDQGTSGAGPGR